MTSKKPDVTIEFTSHWCPKHLEPYEAKELLGAGIASIRIVEKILEMDEFHALVPKDEEGNAVTDAVNSVLLEVAPLCCYVGEEVMGEIYDETLPIN